MIQQKLPKGEGLDNKTIIVKALPSFIIWVVIYLLVIFFHISFMYIALILATLSTILYCYQTLIKKTAAFSIKTYLKSMLKLGIILAIVFGLSYWLGGYGLIGMAALVLIFAGYRIYKGRVLYMMQVRKIETIIWGKPLDKELWNKKKEINS